MKINIRKKALSILCASCVLVTSNVFADTKTENEYVQAKTDVNVRYGESTKSNKIGLFQYKDTAYRILSSDNWDLVRYNDTIGYVSHEYVKVNEKDECSPYEYTEVKDILYTTANVNFRLGPSIYDTKIDLIKANTEIIPIAITNNNWYVVKYNGKIGFVSGEFVRSYSEEIKKQFPVENVSIQKIVYANQKDFIYDTNGAIIGYLEEYEGAYLLERNKDYSLIKTDKYAGYVANNILKEVEGKLIEIDLTDQIVSLYCENDILMRSKTVTGKNSTPTNIGSFKIYAKEKDRYLKGADYNSHVDFWMPFDGGIGLHDATWRKQFGGEIYKKNGSHGCVNLPYDVAEYIYNNVKVGTKVLVHK